MRRGQPRGRVARDDERRPQVERRRLLDAGLERVSGEQRHDEERQPGRFADAEDRDDVVGTEFGRGPGLAQKPLAAVRVRGQFGPQYLQRDRSAQEHLFGREHQSHPTGSEQAKHPVVVEPADLVGRQARPEKRVHLPRRDRGRAVRQHATDCVSSFGSGWLIRTSYFRTSVTNSPNNELSTAPNTITISPQRRLSHS